MKPNINFWMKLGAFVRYKTKIETKVEWEYNGDKNETEEEGVSEYTIISVLHDESKVKEYRSWALADPQIKFKSYDTTKNGSFWVKDDIQQGGMIKIYDSKYEVKGSEIIKTKWGMKKCWILKHEEIVHKEETTKNICIVEYYDENLGIRIKYELLHTDVGGPFRTYKHYHCEIIDETNIFELMSRQDETKIYDDQTKVY